ncbi:MAG: glycosyltransferase [Pseudomonadota bacterium]
MKNCLLVLGMHRSGTSAFTGILDLLGVNLGAQILETQTDNPKGFFENKSVVQNNDCILETLNSSWDDTLPLPPDWPELFIGSAVEMDVRQVLRTDVLEEQLSALKDPRLCRLLPLWLPQFAAEQITPHFALLIRNPLEIAESLRERNGFSTEKSLLLWLQYMLDAELHSRPYRRAFLRFEDLLSEPLVAVNRALTAVGLQPPKMTADQQSRLDQFLDRDLRHHALTANDVEARCPELISRTYRALCNIAAAGESSADDLATLDTLRESLLTQTSLFYNRDLLGRLDEHDLQQTPDWFEQRLAEIRAQFESDKMHRELRYISNTEYVYRDRQALLEVREFTGTLPWRAYKKYQETLERFMPHGGAPRRILQQMRSWLPNREVSHSEQKPSDQTKTTSSSEVLQTWEALQFPSPTRPLVSIVIPVFNNWMFTFKCLRSVLEHTQGDYEVIVVDNHSSDETPAMLAAMSGIKVITNPQNEVFVNACNQAAEHARGDYLLLLNNDTEVTAGWLDAMLEPFQQESTGVVGCKLIYPDGRLQEAGNIVWRDGTGCNYGHEDDPELPWFQYRKEVDYCSGACLLIPITLWQEIGGFDTRYAPAYYEDTDLCFTVRALNYKVVYQPAATVVHYGGASAGKETSSGYKRFQEINREKFVNKWREVLEAEHFPSSAGTFRTREKRGDKHIMIIDHYAPTFDRDSGSQRMVCMLQILMEMGYKVSFWPDDLSYDVRYTRYLQNLGVEIFYGDLDFEAFIAEHGADLTAVLMSRPATAKKYLQLVKKYCTAQTIFDTVDLHFVREQRRAELEAQQWRNLEFFLAEESDTTLVVSPTEQELLSKEPFASKVAVVSNIHTLQPCEKGFEERSGLMFIGGFAHPPNEEGILWFIDYILPIIRKELPEVHLYVVGSDPSERLLAQANDGVTVTGYVEDVSGFFNDCRVFVSPLLHGAGVKGKIGQSFSYGLPVVTTTIGAEGMQLKDGHNALITDSESEFARKVVNLYRDKYLWQKVSANGRQVIRDQFSPSTIRRSLESVLAEKNATPVPRPIIVHSHLFKNAGTTLDFSLQRQFGEGFTDHREDQDMRRGASYLGPYLQRHPALKALSSHHIRFPLPESDQFQLLPLIAIRHPIDRAGSVYRFERHQDASTPGAIEAKRREFPEYVRWRMQSDVAPTLRNFHCSVCCVGNPSEVGEAQFEEALARLATIPLLVVVERYDECMVVLEHTLAPYFHDIDLAYIPQNVAHNRPQDLVQRVDAVDRELGDELSHAFREMNHWDMLLYEKAQAIVDERLGAVGNVDLRLRDFRARCHILSSSH